MPAYDDVRFDPPAPVATIGLVNPDSGASAAGVPMLIDSGADVTPLPAAATAGIGLAGTGERYRLEGFDGTASESEAVRADLLFVGGRIRGRFLLIEGRSASSVVMS